MAGSRGRCLGHSGAATALALVLTVLADALVGGGANAQSRQIACGDFYEVQPGDTLREIALDAYRLGNYQVIFDANRDILSTPSLLLVGQRLFIPCLDGSGPRSRQEAEARVVQEQQAILQPPELTAEQLALPAPVPQPTEEELFGEVEDEAAPEPAEILPERPKRIVRTEVVPQPEEIRLALLEAAVAAPRAQAGRQPFQPGAPAPADDGTSGEGAPAAASTRRAGVAVGVQSVQPGLPAAGRETAEQPAAGGQPRVVARLQPAQPAPATSSARVQPAVGGQFLQPGLAQPVSAGGGLQPAPGASAAGGGGLQPAPGASASSGGGLQPAPGASAASGGGLQPAPGASAAGGGLQPAPGASASSGGGLQPAPGASAAGGGLQPAPGASAAGGGLQPAPGASAAGGGLQPAPGASAAGGGLQPAPGASAAAGGGLQPAPGASAAAGGGLQPAPGASAAAGGGLQPAPGASAGAQADPLSRLLTEDETASPVETAPAVGSPTATVAARGGSSSDGGFEQPVIARLLPQSAPRPPAQLGPDQPIPRLALNLDTGISIGARGPGPDTPALSSGDAADVVGDDAAIIPIRLLTGPYAPYTGQSLPEQGMLTDVVRRALAIADPNRDAKVSFVDDWSAHLSILLPDGAFDLGFPWFKPDCTKMALLSAPMQARCTDYLWSQPLHELVVGYFVAAGSPLETVTDHSELAGLTFCRPAGYYTFDLEQRGLGTPTITLVSPETPADCLARLTAGEVDVVSLSVTLVEGELAKAGLIGQVAELPDLADILTLHVLSPRTNPFGRTYLTLINRGLRDMRESGEWFEVVARHLAEHSERTQ